MISELPRQPRCVSVQILKEQRLLDILCSEQPRLQGKTPGNEFDVHDGHQN